MPAGRPTVEIVIRRRAQAQPVAVGCRGQGRQQGLEIQQRLAHAHHHHVAEPLIRRLAGHTVLSALGRQECGCCFAISQQPLDVEQLLDDFAGREVADQSFEPGRAEGAAHRAADLGADASRAMPLVVAQQDALDMLGVRKLQEQLLRPVGGLLPIDHAAGPYPPFGRKPAAQLGGQVGHFLERTRPAGKEPLSHLNGPICRQPLLDEPVAKPLGGGFKDGRHSRRLRLQGSGFRGRRSGFRGR